MVRDSGLTGSGCQPAMARASMCRPDRVRQADLRPSNRNAQSQLAYTSRPKERRSDRRAGGRYLIDFARGRPTNPARIPVSPLGCWYYTQSKRAFGFDRSNRSLRTNCRGEHFDVPASRHGACSVTRVSERRTRRCSNAHQIERRSGQSAEPPVQPRRVDAGSRFDHESYYSACSMA
jgi:hypothetical protein